jgi:hypothetical protein
MKKVGVPRAPSAWAPVRHRPHARAVLAVVQFAREALRVEAQAFRQRRQGLLVQHVLVFEQGVVHLPELALGAGGLGRFRRRRGEADAGRPAAGGGTPARTARRALHQFGQRRVRAGAVGALEVAVFDQRHLGVAPAAHVVVLFDPVCRSSFLQ